MQFRQSPLKQSLLKQSLLKQHPLKQHLAKQRLVRQASANRDQPDSGMDQLRRRGAGVAQVLRMPASTFSPECAAIRFWDRTDEPSETPVRSPVLLVHGYASSPHMWAPLRAALAQAGFTELVYLHYNTFRADIHRVADWLVDLAHKSMRATGAGGVHLIGHSMGGLVVRDAVLSRGLAGFAGTAVTIATPHAGAPLARFVPGPAARQMRPGSAFLTDLAERRMDQRTRWVVIKGATDRFVPESSSILQGRSCAALDVRQHPGGHGSIARQPSVVSDVVSALMESENDAREGFSLAA